MRAKPLLASFIQALATLALLAATAAAAQTHPGWLRYAIPPDPPRYHGLPHAVVLLGDGAGNIAPEEQTAADELDRGLGHMVAGTDVVLHRFDLRQDAIILGTTDALHRAHLQRHLHGWVEKPLPEEGFRIVHLRRGIREWYVLQGGSPRAELWAAFRFAALVAEDQQLPQELSETPRFALRALDMGAAAALLPLLQAPQTTPTGDSTMARNGFARLLASVGLNTVIAEASAAEAAQLTEQLRPYGLRFQPASHGITAIQAVPQDRPLLPLATPNFGTLPTAPEAAVLPILPVRPTVLAYPAPAWAALLHTPERGPHGDTTLADLLAGAGSPGMRGGLVGTLNAADAAQLLRQPMLHANLYAFGRLAWSPTLSPETITEEWARQTWGDDARAYAAAAHILRESGAAAEAVSAPMGMPWLTDAAGNPTPERMGQMSPPFATAAAVGVDGTRTGTGATSRYPEAFADTLADPARCPPAVLLLFHRLPWRYTLPDGKPLAQHLYDTVFAGAAAAGNAVDAWEGTRGIVDEPRYAAVLAFLQRAAMHTDIVRDTTTEWVQNTSGVRDALGFVGSHPGRIPAADLLRSGFAAPGGGAVKTGESHSDGVQTGEPGSGVVQTGEAGSRALRAVETSGAPTLPCPRDCTATLQFRREANVYRVTIAYRFKGSSTFRLLVNGDTRSTWNVANDAAGGEPATMERFTVNGVRLQPGDTVAIAVSVGTGAAASLDFLEITRDPRWN